MAHVVETMAYSGEVPWHGLGVPVHNDLTPVQMMDAAGLNWQVEKLDMGYTWTNSQGQQVQRKASKKKALVRTSDGKLLDVVGDDWRPLQNEDVFSFFHDFVAAGDMEMHTAGSLQGGKRVWVLAKVNDSFEVVKGDRVQQFLLLSNPHKYGLSISTSMTAIRVVCNNTLSLALQTGAEQMIRVNHRQEFDGDYVKEMLGVAKEKLTSYKEASQFLASRKAKDEDIVEYFKRVFPSMSKDAEKETSRNAALAIEALHQQPGAEFAEGSWWQPFNAVTYLADHTLGRNPDTRMNSAWFGANRDRKQKALKLALEMADA